MGNAPSSKAGGNTSNSTERVSNPPLPPPERQSITVYDSADRPSVGVARYAPAPIRATEHELDAILSAELPDGFVLDLRRLVVAYAATQFSHLVSGSTLNFICSFDVLTACMAVENYSFQPATATATGAGSTPASAAAVAVRDGGDSKSPVVDRCDVDIALDSIPGYVQLRDAPVLDRARLRPNTSGNVYGGDSRRAGTYERQVAGTSVCRTRASGHIKYLTATSDGRVIAGDDFGTAFPACTKSALTQMHETAARRRLGLKGGRLRQALPLPEDEQQKVHEAVNAEWVKRENRSGTILTVYRWGKSIPIDGDTESGAAAAAGRWDWSRERSFDYLHICDDPRKLIGLPDTANGFLFYGQHAIDTFDADSLICSHSHSLLRHHPQTRNSKAVHLTPLSGTGAQSLIAYLIGDESAIHIYAPLTGEMIRTIPIPTFQSPLVSTSTMRVMVGMTPTTITRAADTEFKCWSVGYWPARNWVIVNHYDPRVRPSPAAGASPQPYEASANGNTSTQCCLSVFDIKSGAAVFSSPVCLSRTDDPASVYYGVFAELLVLPTRKLVLAGSTLWDWSTVPAPAKYIPSAADAPVTSSAAAAVAAVATGSVVDDRYPLSTSDVPRFVCSIHALGHTPYTLKVGSDERCMALSAHSLAHVWELHNVKEKCRLLTAFYVESENNDLVAAAMCQA